MTEEEFTYAMAVLGRSIQAVNPDNIGIVLRDSPIHKAMISLVAAFERGEIGVMDNFKRRKCEACDGTGYIDSYNKFDLPCTETCQTCSGRGVLVIQRLASS